MARYARRHELGREPMPNDPMGYRQTCTVHRLGPLGSHSSRHTILFVLVGCGLSDCQVQDRLLRGPPHCSAKQSTRPSSSATRSRPLPSRARPWRMGAQGNSRDQIFEPSSAFKAINCNAVERPWPGGLCGEREKDVPDQHRPLIRTALSGPDRGGPMRRDATELRPAALVRQREAGEGPR